MKKCKLFKYLRIMYKFWFKKSTCEKTYKIPACKDCKHFIMGERNGYCVRPIGKILEVFDPINGKITYKQQLCENGCWSERAYEYCDITKRRHCGKDGIYFKSKHF